MKEQKVALVTGGMGGLGTALCRRLHGAGFAVVAAHTPGNARVAGWLDEQQAQQYYFHPLALDVTDFAACGEAVSSVLAQFGRIDVLVNNAGITRDQSMRKMELPHWSEVMRTNLDSLFNMSKQVLEPMLEHKWGRIINISSVNGQKGAFGQCNYAAAKAGVHGFSKALALEVARHGITVNTVSPGYLRTQMVTAVPTDIMETKILPQIPLGRLGEPDEVAALVAYLASDEAAFVTGANIAINGGQHMS
ncbi:3-oxoacyl-[acyl-carrier-protein] reductase [Janthinobacterium sp. OK676]|uniref:acetoacetyl-CoA reductase n=1 Tax=Janthinobacterium sp. OK676 TaxID=1855295 RepID=UPI00088CF00D|nr:acetoacetyl-CoA reductase [Janthinobacterium sp. OK676]SDO09382.1 3-oxoacyl-[acyl-carrier-protein] reductase [Janthinobacterium sp. OK676]